MGSDGMSDGHPAMRSALDVLPRAFFDRPVLSVAPELLGCVLVHQTSQGIVAVRLTEVEAYAGAVDPASHAFRGRTARNAVMFGEPGHAYVYFTYGMHFCVNLVCQPAGDASAVLLRAGRVIEGAGLAAVRRSGLDRERAARSGLESGSGRGSLDAAGSADAAGRVDAAGRRNASGSLNAAGFREDHLARGPARLCQALSIDRRLNGADVCDLESPLRILRAAGPGQIDRGPRVGVSSGADVEWRFWASGDTTVSAYRQHVARRRNAGRQGTGTGQAAAGPGKSAVTPDPADESMHR